METLEEKLLLLETLGDTLRVAVTDTEGKVTLGATFLGVPGNNTNFIADLGSPFDAQNLDYLYVTIKEEVQKAKLTTGSLFLSDTGIEFKVLSMVPDATGWVTIRTSWEGDECLAWWT